MSSTFPQGTALTIDYVTTVSGVPTDASPAPVITYMMKGDGTFLTPVSFTHVALTGLYSATVFTTGQVNVDGTYEVMVYNASTAIDQPASDPQSWSVGVNVVSSVSAGAVTSIAAGVWDRLASAVTTTGSIGKYILDSLATLLNGVTTTDISAAALAKFITTNTTKTWVDAVSGSVAKLIADNASTSPADIATAVWNALIASYSSVTGSFGAALAYILLQAAKIGTSTFTMNAPGVILPTPPLVTNRAYKAVYGNQIDFTVSNLSISLQATGISAQWRFDLGGYNPPAFVAVITSATAGYFEVDPSDTSDWGESPQGGYPVEFVVLDGTDVIHVQTGKKVVQVGITPTP